MSQVTLLTKVRAWAKKAAPPKRRGYRPCRGRCPVRDWCAVLVLGAAGFVVLAWYAWGLYRTVSVVDAGSMATAPSEGRYERAVDPQQIKEVLRKFSARAERHRMLLEQRAAPTEVLPPEDALFSGGRGDRYNNDERVEESAGTAVDPVFAE